MIRKFFLIVVVMSAVSLIALAVAVQSPVFWQNLIMKVAHDYCPGIKLKSIAIERAHLNSQGDLRFDNVRLTVKVDGISYFFSSGGIGVSKLWSLFKTGSRLPVEINHVAIVSELLNISDLSLKGEVNVNRMAFDVFEGEIKLSALEYDQYALTALSANITSKLGQVDLRDFKALSYKGSLKGYLGVYYSQGLDYKVHIELTNIDLAGLSNVKPTVFGKMQGILSGEVLFEGNADKVRALKLDLAIPHGGRISSKILKMLGEILPKDNLLFMPFNKAVNSFQELPLDSASVYLKNVNASDYTAKINIYSPPTSVDLKYTYDIKIDGGLRGVLDSLKWVMQE